MSLHDDPTVIFRIIRVSASQKIQHFVPCAHLFVFMFAGYLMCFCLLRCIVFGRFLSLFLCQQHYEKTAGPIYMKFLEKVWSDHGTTWLNFGSIRVNGSAAQRSICLLSPAIAQRTGVNKSVSFARWQQGAGFIVPRTTAYFVF